MVEVFKTNVKHKDLAHQLVNSIHNAFKSYLANFDLEDCDRILRVENTTGLVKPALVIGMLQRFGVEAEVLPDKQAESEKQFGDRKVRQIVKSFTPEIVQE